MTFTEDQILAVIDHHRTTLRNVYLVLKTGRHEEMRALIRWSFGLCPGPWKTRETEAVDRPFMEAHCLVKAPDVRYVALAFSPRKHLCRRWERHKPPHRSWTREWNDGDARSQLRKDK